MHYRARTYDPQTGRFMQRDPLGYVDGMNLYEYVKSSVTMYVDPMGLSRKRKLTGDELKTLALTKIEEFRQSHSEKKCMNGTQTYKPQAPDLLGLENLLKKVEKGLNWLDGNDYGYISPNSIAAAQYKYIINDLEISETVSATTLIHEGVHVYNDLVDEYEKYRLDEGMANVVTEMLTSLNILEMVEEAFVCYDCVDCSKVQSRWNMAVKTFNQSGNIDLTDDYGFKTNESDIKNVAKHLGFQFDCQKVADRYNQLLDAKGANCPKLTCDQAADVFKQGIVLN